MTDRLLVQRYVTDTDQAAFAALVDRHGGMVLSAARRLAGDDAEDIAQAVFLLLSQKAAKLTHHTNLAGWLYEATRYCAADVIRDRKKQTARILAAREAAMANASTAIDHTSLIAQLDEGLARLSSRYKQVLLMRYMEDLSVDETAQRLGLTSAAVLKRSTRGLARLRDFFQRRGITVSSDGLTGCMVSQAIQLPGFQQYLLASQCIGSASTHVAALASSARTAMIITNTKLIAVIAAIVVAASAVTIQSVRMAKAARSSTIPSVATTMPTSQPATAVSESPFKILDTQLGTAGQRVLVASKLDEMGRPTLVETVVVKNLIVTTLPPNDVRTIPVIKLPGGPVHLADALNLLKAQAHIDFHVQMDPGNQVVQFSPGRHAFWEAQQELVEKCSLNMFQFADDPPRKLALADLGAQGEPRRTSGPWGLITLWSADRVTQTVPPAWVHHEELRFNADYRPDPAAISALVYPVQTWVDGQWKATSNEMLYVTDALKSGPVSFRIPPSQVVNGIIPHIKCQMPVNMAFRTQTLDLDLATSQNVAVMVDGLVIHFFNLKRNGDQVTLQFGMICQNGQSSETFTQLCKIYNAWMTYRLMVSDGDGKRIPLFNSGGRSRDGSFEVMDLNASGLPGNGPVQLRWELPSVTQMANVEFTFDNVEAP